MVAQVDAIAANQMREPSTTRCTRSQAKELEAHGVNQQFLFLENYKNGVGTMSASDINHNNRSAPKRGRARSPAASTHAMATRSESKTATNSAKEEINPLNEPVSSRLRGRIVNVNTVCDAKAPAPKSRPKPAVAKLPPPKTGKQLAKKRKSDTKSVPHALNSKRCSPKNRGGSSVIRPRRVKYIIRTNGTESQPENNWNEPMLDGRNKSEQCLATTTTTKHKVPRPSVRLSPPPLTQQERNASPQVTVDAMSPFRPTGNDGRLPPDAVFQRKREVLEMLDHLLPLHIFDGRANYDVIKNRLSSLVVNVVAEVDQQHLRSLRASSSGRMVHPSNSPIAAELPTPGYGEQALSPQNVPFGFNNNNNNNNNFAVYNYGGARGGIPPGVAVTEDRNESYGRGAFCDVRLSVLLPDTPVYTQNLTRRLAANGHQLTETNRREVIPTDALTPEQIEMLKSEGFRAETIQEPVDKSRLTKMQRMAVDDMFGGDRPGPSGSIQY